MHWTKMKAALQEEEINSLNLATRERNLSITYINWTYFLDTGIHYTYIESIIGIRGL